ncbi:MAG: SPOR domain-containing protein [Muribaculaceae bacterium]|nr:SPOR domain-containing protein [Muribaculaceae bacterium]
MALIKCTECGHMISDKAMNCPKCGCPVRKGSDIAKNYDDISQQPMCYSGNNRANIRKLSYAIIALLLAVLAGGGYYFYNMNKQQEEDYQKKLIAVSITRNSITKLGKARLNSIKQTNKENSLQSQQQSIKAPAVYYVVIGSYSSLQNAIKGRDELMYISPEWLSPPPIFTDVAKGKVVYRLCSGIFERIDKAKERASFIKEELDIDAWIWKSNGLATCVDRPIDESDRPVNINPW